MYWYQYLCIQQQYLVLEVSVKSEIGTKKTKVRLYQPLILQQNELYALYITNKMECFSFKSWLCRTGGEAFERGLVGSFEILMMA